MSKTILCGLLAIIGAGIGVPVAAQSLADVAKQEEDRRKAIRAPAKVYTNKDLGAVPSGPAPPAPPAPAEAAKDADKEKADKDLAGKDPKDPSNPRDASTPPVVKDQTYWSGRLKDVRTQVDRDQGYLDAMQTRLNSLNADFVNRDDPVQRAAIERDRQRTQGELARLTKAVQDGRKALADLLEEARRAGVPPGWLR